MATKKKRAGRAAGRRRARRPAEVVPPAAATVPSELAHARHKTGLLLSWAAMNKRPPLEGDLTPADALRAVVRIEAWCVWARDQIAEGAASRIRVQLQTINDAIDRIRHKPYRAADLRNLVTSHLLASATHWLPEADPEIAVDEIFSTAIEYARSLSPELADRLKRTEVIVRETIRIIPTDRRRAILTLRSVLDDKPTPGAKDAARDAERDFDGWLGLRQR